MSSDSDELRHHIEETRAELADTVEALSAKADVKGRAQAKASELSGQAKHRASELGTQARTYATQESQVAREQLTRTQAEKPWLFPAAGGIAVLSLLTWFFARRRNS